METFEGPAFHTARWDYDSTGGSQEDPRMTKLADQVVAWTGGRPGVVIGRGEPSAAVLATVADDPSIHALVLGAAPKGAPGPLVAFFAGERAGTLPCLVMIVPGGLPEERLEDLT